MAIKSLEELRALREKFHKQVTFREKGETPDDSTIEILVGMGTCGIAAGARETFGKFLEVLDAKGLDTVKVISVGCVGYCQVEPTVQVNIPGKEPVIFGPITEKEVEELVDTVIIKNDLLDDKYIVKTFTKAVI